MSNSMEFTDLAEEPGGSAERPNDLPAAANERRQEPDSGTPLREISAQSQARRDNFRTIVMGFVIFSTGVTIALVVQIAAGAPQIEPHGAVASPSKLCSEMGVQQLRNGGNAVDAAITTMLCVGLVLPQYAGIGGGGFFGIHNHKTHNTTMLDFRESAPEGLVGVDLDKRKLEVGPLGVGVPGEIAGMWEASQRFGKLSWRALFTPVVELARKGFPVNKAYQLDLDRRRNMGHFEDEETKEFREKFEPSKAEWKRPDLAAVFEKIAEAENGHKAFYEGEIAEAIVKTVQDRGGVLSMEDLKNYRVVERKPLTANVSGYMVEAFPAPGSGALLIRMLEEMESEMKSSEKTQIKFQSPEYYGMLAKVQSEVYPCREHLADPFGDYADAIRSIEKDVIDMKIDVKSECAGKKPQESHGTSHISVIDKDELMVSVTTSMNYWFGSLLVTENGILLNNQMADFSLDPKSANSIKGGKRPRSGMVPSFVFNKDHPCKTRFAIGGVNGTRIVSGVAQVTANIILFHEKKLQTALDAPRLFCTGTECIVSDLSGAGDSKDRILEEIGAVEDYLRQTETVNLVVVALHHLNDTVQAETDHYMDYGGASY